MCNVERLVSEVAVRPKLASKRPDCLQNFGNQRISFEKGSNLMTEALFFYFLYKKLKRNPIIIKRVPELALVRN